MSITYLNIYSKSEFENRLKLPKEESRFEIDENSSVYNHLGAMFNEHVKRTNKILVGGDCILSNSDMIILVELIEYEEKKLNNLFLDSWEFQVHPKIELLNRIELEDETNYNRTNIYLAKKAIELSNYEIRKGQLDNYKFEVTKTWHKISKLQIQLYLSNLKSIINDAINKELIITSTYY